MNIVGGSTLSSGIDLAAVGSYLLAAWMVVRVMVAGVASVGLFFGALYFLYYLLRLSRLDPRSR